MERALFNLEKFKTPCRAEEKNCGRCKKIILSKLGTYSVLYGLFSINFIDLVIAGPAIAGYHVWLTVAYFSPFIPLLLLFGFDDWELVGALGFTASLMNDAFYYPVGRLILGINVNLVDWYAFQLGFKGLEVWWNFNAGFIKIPVSSLLMGLTIYARIAIIFGLLYRWWNYKRTCHKYFNNLKLTETVVVTQNFPAQ